MVDWNVGYNTGDYWVRIGGGGGNVPYYPPAYPGTYPGGVLVPNQNNQMIWLLLIVAGAVLLLKD